MIVFTLMVMFCASATECQWSTVMHFVRESYCEELGREYLREPNVRRYKCLAAVRE